MDLLFTLLCLLQKSRKNTKENYQLVKKCHFRVLFDIIRSGDKLNPLIIFKYKEEGNVDAMLNSLPLVKKGKVLVFAKKKAWNDKTRNI